MGEEEEEEVLLGLGGHSGSERVPATWKRSTQRYGKPTGQLLVRRRAHRGSERDGSAVRPQYGYNPEILSHLSPKSPYPQKVFFVCFWKEQ